MLHCGTRIVHPSNSGQVQHKSAIYSQRQFFGCVCESTSIRATEMPMWQKHLEESARCDIHQHSSDGFIILTYICSFEYIVSSVRPASFLFLLDFGLVGTLCPIALIALGNILHLEILSSGFQPSQYRISCPSESWLVSESSPHFVVPTRDLPYLSGTQWQIGSKDHWTVVLSVRNHRLFT